MSIRNNFLGLNGGTQSSNYPSVLNIKSDVNPDSLIYAIYPTIPSSSHVNMKSYMDNFPNGSVSLPSALPNSFLYSYIKSATGNVRAVAFSGVTTFFTGQHITLPDDTTIKVNLAENVGLIMSSNDTGCTSYNNL